MSGRQHALEVNHVCELVTSDSHLASLGDWLVDQEDQCMAEEWRLEKMSTSWIWDLKVV